MCLITNKKDPYIAAEKITAYKLMDKPIFYIFLFSYIRTSLWILKIPRFAKMSPKKLHNRTGVTNYRIEEGLYAYTTLHESLCSHIEELNIIICEVNIPKGAKYYISEDGKEIVSNKKKITKILKNMIKFLFSFSYPMM